LSHAIDLSTIVFKVGLLKGHLGSKCVSSGIQERTRQDYTNATRRLIEVTCRLEKVITKVPGVGPVKIVAVAWKMVA